MRIRFRTALSAIASVAVARSAAGQTAASASDQCADSVGPAAYERCALWLDGSRVRRGSDATVVAKPGFFVPARLSRLVVGDSARAYAAAYERNARRSNLLGGLSAAMLVAAYLVADAYDCDRGAFGICTNSDDNYALATAGLAVASIVTLVASVPFTVRATRAMGRAVWWHNARFAR